MSKERLEDIKNSDYSILKVDSDLKRDWDWLIEQAEQVQELENENRILRTVAESNKYIGEQYLEQNKRYREALEEIKFKTLDIKGNKDTRPFQIFGIVSEALEGEE